MSVNFFYQNGELKKNPLFFCEKMFFMDFTSVMFIKIFFGD